MKLLGRRPVTALTRTAGATTTRAARPCSSGTTRTALRHFRQTLSLFVGQNLRQSRVDVLLECVEILPLLVSQFELIDQERREHLTGTHATAAGTARAAAESAESAGTTASVVTRTTRTCTGTASSSWSLDAGFFRKVGGRFVAGEDSVFIGIRPLEEGLQAGVTDFGSDQLAVAVGVELKQPADGGFGITSPATRSGSPTTGAARATARRTGLCECR